MTFYGSPYDFLRLRRDLCSFIDSCTEDDRLKCVELKKCVEIYRQVKDSVHIRGKPYTSIVEGIYYTAMKHEITREEMLLKCSMHISTLEKIRAILMDSENDPLRLLQGYDSDDERRRPRTPRVKRKYCFKNTRREEEIMPTDSEVEEEIAPTDSEVEEEPVQIKSTKCPHGRKDKYYCRKCWEEGIGGNGYCKHGRYRKRCYHCSGKETCEHRRVKQYCNTCYHRKRYTVDYDTLYVGKNNTVHLAPNPRENRDWWWGIETVPELI